MENINITPEGIIVSTGFYAGLGLIGSLKYLARKRKCNIQSLIVGSYSGKSTLCKTFNDLYKNESYYFLDLEHLLLNDCKLPETVKSELIRLKKEDPILYTARVVKLYKGLMNDILPTLKKMNKVIVVVLSSRSVAKFLGIKQRIYLTSDRKLYKQQREEGEYKEYMDFCRSSMKQQKTELYSNYEEMLKKVLQIYGITDKL